MEYITNTLGNLVQQTAFLNLTWGNYIMIGKIGNLCTSTPPQPLLPGIRNI